VKIADLFFSAIKQTLEVPSATTVQTIYRRPPAIH